jgi:hypothetical protein
MLVERLLAAERARANSLRSASAARAETSPEPEQGATPQVSPAQQPNYSATSQESGDFQADFTRALPVAVNPEVWNGARERRLQNVRFEARFKDGELLELAVVGGSSSAIESLRGNLSALLRRVRFSAAGAPRSGVVKLEIQIQATSVGGTDLPAYGYVPPTATQLASAFAVFPSGLRVDARVRLLD